ncbi:MAG: glutamyl-tRNA reductase [Acidimicrobiales bacterium]|nr:glutamyl-tRNA reductase [Acidimicrobiales bacterium]
MSIVVIGLNHRTAPLDLLERTNVDDAHLPKALHDLRTRPNVSEAVVLSTCNRTEVYVVADRFHGATHDVRLFLGELADLAPDGLGDHLYTHYDESAVAHLFSVASGLDSAVLGESEILGQMKAAWELARGEGASRSGLNLLFRHAVEVGKRVRTETGIARNITSISQAAVALAAERLGTLRGRRVLVLGAGDMGEGMATALAGAGVAGVVVANRTLERAEALADRVGGEAVALGDVGDALAGVDVLLTSTGATSIMLEHADLAPILARRPDRPLLIVDVAVPRDVDRAVGELPGVTLLDMDDLRAFAQAGVAERSREVGRVRALIDLEVERYLDTRTAREAAPLVAGLRSHAEQVRRAELERLRGRLDGLDERQREAVEALTKGILAKLLHGPTVRLKEVAGSPRGELLAEALRDLFDL